MRMKLYNNINTSAETIKVYISKYFYIFFENTQNLMQIPKVQ